MILERTRNDFRRAGTAAVYKDGHRECGPVLRFVVEKCLRRCAWTRAQLHDRLTRIEEQFRHRDALLQQSAGISAQVDHECVCALSQE